MGDRPVKRAEPGRSPAGHSLPGTQEGFAQWCRAACLALPGAAVDWPFGPDSDVFRIHGKMFALLWRNPRVSEHMIVNLKAEPDEVPLLIATYEVVGPGFHMNKRHWITVELCPAADLGFVEELIEDSYDNVVAGLPARLRSSLQSLSAAPSWPTTRVRSSQKQSESLEMIASNVPGVSSSARWPGRSMRAAMSASSRESRRRPRLRAAVDVHGR